MSNDTNLNSNFLKTNPKHTNTLRSSVISGSTFHATASKLQNACHQGRPIPFDTPDFQGQKLINMVSSSLSFKPGYDQFTNSDEELGKNLVTSETIPTLEIKAKLQKLKDCFSEKDDKFKQREMLSAQLETSGYLVDSKHYNDSKFKIKRISLYRNPNNKEFNSMKTCKNETNSNSKSSLQSSEFSILKKRRYSKSAKRRYNSEIEVDDYLDPKTKHYFKVFIDEDIGITPAVQVQMEISVIKCIYQ